MIMIINEACMHAPTVALKAILINFPIDRSGRKRKIDLFETTRLGSGCGGSFL
jgi:hypothetical protein